MKSFTFLVGLTFLTTSILAADFIPYEAHIDTVEDGQYIQVFSKAGETWKTCEKVTDPGTQKPKCKNAVGWLGPDAKIMVLSPPFLADTIDTLTEDEKKEKYVKIEFEYNRNGIHQKGKSYIELYNLSRNESTQFYGNKKAENDPKKKCPTDVKNPNNELSKTKSLFEPLYSSITHFDLNQKAEKLSEVAGFCPLKPPSKLPSPLPKGNPYDQIILSELKRKPVPRITKENGESMSQQDLINIDSLARTLYGEMAICYKYGLQYPMTVAKMIINREKDKKQRSIFIQPPQDDSKPDLAKVATTAAQFSMWKRNGGIIPELVKPSKKKKKKSEHNPLLQGLCPPQKPNQPFWRDVAPSIEENNIWTNTMRIATEAILYPEQFKKRTTEVDGFHYTSGMADRKKADEEKAKKLGKKFKESDKTLPRGARFIEKMKQSHPAIEGRSIEQNSCLEVWKE